MRLIPLVALAAAALAAVALGAAPAGAVTWTAVTGSLGASINQAGQVRSPDGTLHVVWKRDTPGASTSDVFHVAISPAGVVSSVSTIATGFASVSNPAIVITPGGGLAVFFGGIQCTTTGCPEGLFTAGSTDGGGSWGTPTSLLDTDQAYASDVNATTLSDGTPFETWWHTTGVTVHRGASSASPDYDFQGAMGAGCCGYYSNLAADGSGHLQLAWDSNATGFIGTWSRAVDATGAPSGSPLLMPGSVTNYSGSPNQSQMGSRTPIVALPGAANQFFVAYPSGYPTTSKVLLWHVGDPTSSTVVDETGDHKAVSLAADASGRLWVFWTHGGFGADHVFARRLGTGGYEPIIALGAPAASNSIYSIDGSVAPNGDPEVLALAGFPNGSYVTYYARGLQTGPLPAPVLGKSFTASVIDGQVFVKLPSGHAPTAALAKGQGFVPLTSARVLPAGTSVDSRAGSIQITAATGKSGKTQSGAFGGGLFKLSQDRGGPSKGLTTLSLREGAFPGAPGYAQCGLHKARDRVAMDGRAAKASPSKILQTLHARDNHGRFRTRTQASAGTVRGTVWDTIDTCGGTITRVERGTVDVFAFRAHKTVVVHAGHSYYAKLRR